MIPRNAWTLVILLLLVFSLALLLGNVPLLALGIFTFLLAIIGLGVRAPSDLDMQRRCAKTTVWVEEHVTIEWEVRVQRGIGPIFIHDVLPKEVELVSGNNYRVFWKGLGPARFSNAYTLRCPKRGAYQLPPTQWEARHPLEFQQPLQGDSQDTLKLSVLPRLFSVRRIRNVRGLARTPYPVVDLARIGVATTEFSEIREYVAGDPVRLINWKATARRSPDDTHPPLVNQYELEGKKAIWLFLDSSTYMEVGTTLRSPLEHAIEAASALAYHYLTRGYYLGAHFASQPDTLLYPEAGKRQFHKLTQELLSLEPRGATYDLVRAIQVCRAHLSRFMPRCIILTRLDAWTTDSRGLPFMYEELFKGVRGLLAFSSGRRKRISIWVVAINGYNYAQREKETTRLGIALRALDTRAPVRALRRMGVSVLEWDPFQEEFAQALLRQLRLEKE